MDRAKRYDALATHLRRSHDLPLHAHERSVEKLMTKHYLDHRRRPRLAHDHDEEPRLPETCPTCGQTLPVDNQPA